MNLTNETLSGTSDDDWGSEVIVTRIVVPILAACIGLTVACVGVYWFERRKIMREYHVEMQKYFALGECAGGTIDVLCEASTDVDKTIGPFAAFRDCLKQLEFEKQEEFVNNTRERITREDEKQRVQQIITQSLPSILKGKGAAHHYYELGVVQYLLGSPKYTTNIPGQAFFYLMCYYDLLAKVGKGRGEDRTEYLKGKLREDIFETIQLNVQKGIGGLYASHFGQELQTWNYNLLSAEVVGGVVEKAVAGAKKSRSITSKTEILKVAATRFATCEKKHCKHNFEPLVTLSVKKVANEAAQHVSEAVDQIIEGAVSLIQGGVSDRAQCQRLVYDLFEEVVSSFVCKVVAHEDIKTSMSGQRKEVLDELSKVLNIRDHEMDIKKRCELQEDALKKLKGFEDEIVRLTADSKDRPEGTYELVVKAVKALAKTSLVCQTAHIVKVTTASHLPDLLLHRRLRTIADTADLAPTPGQAPDPLSAAAENHAQDLMSSMGVRTTEPLCGEMKRDVAEAILELKEEVQALEDEGVLDVALEGIFTWHSVKSPEPPILSTLKELMALSSNDVEDVSTVTRFFQTVLENCLQRCQLSGSNYAFHRSRAEAVRSGVPGLSSDLFDFASLCVAPELFIEQFKEGLAELRHDNVREYVNEAYDDYMNYVFECLANDVLGYGDRAVDVIVEETVEKVLSVSRKGGNEPWRLARGVIEKVDKHLQNNPVCREDAVHAAVDGLIAEVNGIRDHAKKEGQQAVKVAAEILEDLAPWDCCLCNL